MFYGGERELKKELLSNIMTLIFKILTNYRHKKSDKRAIIYFLPTECYSY